MEILKSVYGTTNLEEIEELSISLESSDKLTKLITYAPYIYSANSLEERKRRGIMVGLDNLSLYSPISKESYVSKMTNSYVRKNALSIEKKDYLRERFLIGTYKTKKNKEIFRMFINKFLELSKGIDDLTINDVKDRVVEFLEYAYPFIITHNSVRSISNNNVNVRNLIKNIPNPNQTFRNILLTNLIIGNKKLDTSLDTSIMRNREKEVKRKIEEKNFHEDAIDVVEEIEKIEKIIKNIPIKNPSDYHHINVLEVYIIALATGRRFTEIMKSVTISESGYWNGILKKKLEDKGTYKAYIFKFTREEINNKLERLRARLRVLTKGSKKYDEMSEKDIANAYNGRYNNILRTYTDKVNSFHEVRHHWAINGVKQFKESGESDKETRQRILSHVIPLDASETYSRIFKK